MSARLLTILATILVAVFAAMILAQLIWPPSAARRFVQDCWVPSQMLVPYGWPSDKPYIVTETPPPQCR